MLGLPFQLPFLFPPVYLIGVLAAPAVLHSDSETSGSSFLILVMPSLRMWIPDYPLGVPCLLSTWGKHHLGRASHILSESPCQGLFTSDLELEGWSCILFCPSPWFINQLDVYANVSLLFPGHVCEMLGCCFRNKDSLF